jgi:hypothetical protein
VLPYVKRAKKVIRKYGEDAMFAAEYRDIECEVGDALGPWATFEFHRLTGYNQQKGLYVWIDGIGAIDQYLAPWIVAVNAMGFTTRYCCSGIMTEHDKKVSEGYVSFEGFDPDIRSSIVRASEKVGAKMDDRGTVVRIHGKTDEARKELWRSLLLALIEESVNNKRSEVV